MDNHTKIVQKNKKIKIKTTLKAQRRCRKLWPIETKKPNARSPHGTEMARDDMLGHNVMWQERQL